MKYKLIIDKNAEEEIIAVVHAPSSLTQQIENLVCSYSGEDYIMGYRDDEMRKLAFSEIECITILNRKVIAIDIGGNHFSLKDRLRDLEGTRTVQPVPASTPVFELDNVENSTVKATTNDPNSHQQMTEKNKFCAMELSQK